MWAAAHLDDNRFHLLEIKFVATAPGSQGKGLRNLVVTHAEDHFIEHCAQYPLCNCVSVLANATGKDTAYEREGYFDVAALAFHKEGDIGSGGNANRNFLMSCAVLAGNPTPKFVAKLKEAYRRSTGDGPTKIKLLRRNGDTGADFAEYYPVHPKDPCVSGADPPVTNIPPGGLVAFVRQQGRLLLVTSMQHCGLTADDVVGIGVVSHQPSHVGNNQCPHPRALVCRTGIVPIRVEGEEQLRAGSVLWVDASMVAAVIRRSW